MRTNSPRFRHSSRIPTTASSAGWGRKPATVSTHSRKRTR